MMTSQQKSGQGKFQFIHRKDLTHLPAKAQTHEVDLHGGFAVDEREGFGHVYYGMPGLGLMRVEHDLSRQEIIRFPEKYTPMSFHSTKIGVIDGQPRLILPTYIPESRRGDRWAHRAISRRSRILQVC